MPVAKRWTSAGSGCEPALRWLVDGYNLIRREPDLRTAEGRGLVEGRRALLALVAMAARRTGDPFTVVFDGAPGPALAPSGGQVQVVFSRPPETADDVLIRLAHRYHEGAIVVSSDRTVQDAARRTGASVLEVDEFVGALREGGGGEPDPGDSEPADLDERRAGKRGNPRRLSKDARTKLRALRRLRGR
ncbi:MAG: NYN domain-containing protein [Candidatus Rokubacteria bacterium]|nr:NYN domain-containing protein [Candidatus Rokubacteria bacterium]